MVMAFENVIPLGPLCSTGNPYAEMIVRIRSVISDATGIPAERDARAPRINEKHGSSGNSARIAVSSRNASIGTTVVGAARTGADFF
jgi:hypothetical protein